MRLVTFGTSLTAKGTWPEALAHQLAICLDRPVELENLAKVGETSRWGLAHLDAVIAAKPDIVTIEFSANDAALNRLVTLDESRSNVRSMVQRLRQAVPGARIVLMIMNPMYRLRGAWIRPRLDVFYDSYLALAKELGVGLVDHRPAWAALPSSVRVASIPDGVHPRPSVATAIIAPALLEHLAPGCRVGM